MKTLYRYISLVALLLLVLGCGTLPTVSPNTPIAPTATNEPAATASPRDTDTPIPAVTPTVTLFPSIIHTPPPIDQIVLTLTLPMGGASCGDLVFALDQYHRSLVRQLNANVNFFSADTEIEDFEPYIRRGPLTEGNLFSGTCFRASPSLGAGDYYLSYTGQLFKEQGPQLNSATHTQVGEVNAYLHVRVLPPVSGTDGLIAFVSNRSGEPGLYLTNAAGTELSLLTADLRLFQPTYWAWSPDGSHLAVPAHSNIYVFRLSDLERLELGIDADSSTSLAWSPDSTRLVVMSYEGPVLVGLDGAEPVMLPRGEQFAWSPDGTRLAYSAHGDNNYDVFVLNLADFTSTAITHLPDDEKYPLWSPNGTHLVFFTGNSGEEQLYTLNLAGAEPTQVTAAQPTDIAWSPDGQQVVFVCMQGARPNVCVANVDGGGLINLTTATQGGWQPDWSPDSAQIAFSKDFQVGVVSPAGGTARALTPDLFGGGYEKPHWSPNGMQLLLGGANHRDLHIVNVDGTGLTNLTRDALSTIIDADWQP